jgi:hypothetical protein
MKMISLDEPFSMQRRAILARYTDAPVFEPWMMTNKQAVGLMYDLAELERSTIASAHDRVFPELERAQRDQPAA